MSRRLLAKMTRSKGFRTIVICANALIIVIALLIGALNGKPGVAFKEGELVTYFSSLQLGMCSVVSGLNLLLVFLSEK